MSDNLGPAGLGEEPESVAPIPEYLEPLSGSVPPREEPPSRGSGKKRGALIAGSVLTVSLLGAGAWAATMYFATGAQPTDALPASTVAYVTVDVEPSGEQQVEAYRFLNKFPAIRAELNLDEDTDLREELFSWAQEQGGCADVNFAEDIEPWLGTTAAVAAVNLSADKIAPVLVLEVTDEDAAQSGLEALRDCSGADEVGGWSIADGWTIIAEDAATAEQVAAAAKTDPLSDDADHAAWLDEVGDLGILTVYAGPDALRAIVEQAEAAQLPADPMLESYRELYEDFPGMAGTLRFADAGLEFEAVSAAQQNGAAVMGSGTGDSVAALPADTAVALGFSVGEGYAEQVEKQLSTLAFPGNASNSVRELERETGLDFPADLQTILGDAFVVAVGGDIDIDAVANSGDGSDVPVGIKITGDPAGIESVLEKLRAAFGPIGAEWLASESSGNVVVVGPSPDYRSALLGDGGLGESETFTDVVGDVDNAGGVVFVDFGDWLDRATASSGDPDLVNFERLRGLGVNASLDGDIARMTLRLSTD